ncbi:GNAT family N-acetyltransferase [Pseudonocardia sp. KRD-184]|uniref:GNAT family N-acetyltransferase n=1 Tax=Pseudonocardia oceani TaxID=2792013 RepID=A0ABS6UBE7_9PSEU|nr:GNAT family protein [Pseudonocardia oceani]MBW0092213.1 GNAT family N-acetyltransferase [Pseudonocardia oceani]MBW0098938.1 GNAT family N-acetyltransferase [Pseudonocardia oceani]MBW0111447.1 GNAT family N-acetyltransferase [Pseudonocardia oceani]MBW0125166.1 GNAT family N-acetyltransferase [Pseudonocardia oceani]MBW0129557.1 GNAT family N-acetyltransferase [Pseudonocardia oceani]
MTSAGAHGGRHPGWPARLGALRVGAGVVELRPVRLRDGPAWSALRLRDEAHLAPWEPTMPGTWAQRHSSAEWPGRWMLLRSAARKGTALPFAITVDDRLAGHVMIGNVVREPLLSAYVGYWCDARVTGAGVTTAAVAMAVDHCLGPAGLHRLEATVRPENRASRRVLEKLGFREEGLFRRYLDVDGAWRDHLCFALTAEEVPPNGLSGRLVSAGRAERA